MELQESITVTPTNTNTQIIPLDEHLLDPPFNNSATYDRTAKTLTYSCSLLLPSGIDFSKNNIQVQQYYDSGNASVIEFYFIYDQTGTPGDFVQQDVIVQALSTDYNGHPITLSGVTQTKSLIENQDPKTSRGTVTTVVRTGQP